MAWLCCSQAFITTSLWPLAVCKYGGEIPGRLGHKTGDRDMESIVIHFSCWHVPGILNKWYLCFRVNAVPLNGHYKKSVEILCLGLPMCVYPTNWYHAHDQICQAFPLRVCMLQVISCCRWKKPKNKAGSLVCRRLQTLQIIIHSRTVSNCKQSSTGTGVCLMYMY